VLLPMDRDHPVRSRCPAIQHGLPSVNIHFLHDWRSIAAGWIHGFELAEIPPHSLAGARGM